MGVGSEVLVLLVAVLVSVDVVDTVVGVDELPVSVDTPTGDRLC